MDDVDRSVEADARRFRWLLEGHGFFLEEHSLCGYPPCSDDEKDRTRREIDKAAASEQ